MWLIIYNMRVIRRIGVFCAFVAICVVFFVSVVYYIIMAKNALKMIVSVSDSAALFFINLCAFFLFFVFMLFWHSDFFIFIVFVLLSFLCFTLLTHLLTYSLTHLLTYSLTYLLAYSYLITTIIIIYNILISFVCAHIRTHVRTHTANKAQKKEVLFCTSLLLNKDSLNIESVSVFMPNVCDS